MQNNNYRREHPRGSSPDQEMKQGGDNWVKDLRSLEQPPENSLTPLCGVDQRGNQRMELTAQESGPRQQTGDETRWQDWRRKRSSERRQASKLCNSSSTAVHFL